MVEEAIFFTEENTVLYKKAIAKILYTKKIDQSSISKILNLSQPMVSNYISSKGQIPDYIIKNAEKISDQIIKGKKITFHTSITFSNSVLEGSYFIAAKNELISQEKSKIIDNLTEAFLNLKGKDLDKLVPKVKINIAMTKENPQSPEDIAAFQNGLVLVDDRISSNNGIAFGKSKHLSKLLIDLKGRVDASSVMNIAYIPELKSINFKLDFLTRDFKLKKSTREVDILVHEGDFGIEPCAYVLGKDAVDVTNKILKIVNGIKNEK